MIMRGHVHQGVVVPDEPTDLPEGAPVRFHVLGPSPSGRFESSSSEEWTEAKNARRCDLIRKKFKSGQTPEETAELERLQEASGQFRELFEPLAPATVLALEAVLQRIQSTSAQTPREPH